MFELIIANKNSESQSEISAPVFLFGIHTRVQLLDIQCFECQKIVNRSRRSMQYLDILPVNAVTDTVSEV